MRLTHMSTLCSAVATSLFAGAALAQDCATAPNAIAGANPFATEAAFAEFLMPAGNGCASAHTIHNATFFTFTAATAGSYSFSLCGGSTWDTRIAILNTCDPNAGVLGCNDDSCGLQSLATATLAAGQTYKVVIGGYGSTGFGAGTLNITAPSGGGGGGGCSSAAAVTLGDNLFTNTATGTIIDMTGICQMQFTPQFYNTNYYKFTPTESGSYRFSLCSQATFDTKIAVMNACDPTAGVLACNDDGAGCTGFTSLITGVELQAGTEYKIAIGGYSATTTVGGGTLSISVNTPAGCDKAPTLALGLNPFDTTGQTGLVDLTGICDPGAFGDDIIYSAAIYTFTPAQSAVYSVSTCNLAGFDTRIAVMEGCAPSDGVLACNDDGADCANFSSFIQGVELEGGVTYYIAIGGFSAADAGPGQIELSVFVPCELATATVTEVELCGEDLNGGCNNAGGGFPTEPIAVGQTVQGTFWADAGTRDTDWYLLDLAEATEVTLTIRSSIISFAAFVDTGCGGIMGTITAGDCPGTTSLCLAPGQYYIVALPRTFEGFPCGNPIGNDYTLEVTGVPCKAAAPENDNCADATVAVEGANPFDNMFAGTEVADPSCGFGGTPFTKDVWFSFTATQDGDYNFETCTGPAPFDTGIEIWNDCPANGGSIVGCNDDGAGCQFALASSVNYGMTSGQIVLVRVAGWGGDTGATDLTITYVGDAPSCGDPGTGDCCVANGTPFCEDATCCALICAGDAFCCDVEWDQFCANAAVAQCAGCGVEPPANDECSGALNLPVGTTAFNTQGASGVTAACTKFENPNIYNDIWFSHTATGNGEMVISLCGASYDSKIAVFDACGGNLIACNDDAVAPAACAGTLQSEIRFTPTCGTSYRISVGAFGPAGFGAGDIVVTQEGSCAQGDLNGDGVVNASDMAIMLNAWGSAAADLNGDGTTDSQDLAILLNGWTV